MDPPRRARVTALTKDVGSELESRKKDVLEALRNPDSRLSKRLSEGRTAYRGTAAEGWFQDAQVLAKLRKGVDGFQAAANIKRPTPSRYRQLQALIERTAAAMKTVEFRHLAEALVSRVQPRRK